MDTLNIKSAMLPHADRALLPVRYETKKRCDAARKSHEHRWQTYERLLAIGLKYQHLEDSDALAS